MVVWPYGHLALICYLVYKSPLNIHKKKIGRQEEPKFAAAPGSRVRPAVPRSKTLCRAVAEVAATVAGHRTIDGLVDERGIGHEFRQGASPARGDRRVVAADLSKPRSISSAT